MPEFHQRDRGYPPKGSLQTRRNLSAVSSWRAPPLRAEAPGVEAMMEQGTTFSDVEDVIDASELSTVHKAALWLLASSLHDIEQQRQDAAAYAGCHQSTASWEAGDAGASGARTRSVGRHPRSSVVSGELHRTNQRWAASLDVVCPRTHSNSTSAVFRWPSRRSPPPSARDGSLSPADRRADGDPHDRRSRARPPGPLSTGCCRR